MSALFALLCVLLVHVQVAWAADAHGVAVAPCVAEFAAPTVAWSPGLAAAGTHAACATGEFAESPVVAQISDASGSRLYSPLDDLFGALPRDGSLEMSGAPSRCCRTPCRLLVCKVWSSSMRRD